MKTRTKIDILLILLLLSGCSFYAYKYLGEPKNTSQNIKLEESVTPVISESTSQVISETSASDSSDSWYPQILSNRWKHIEIYQTGLLSGNSGTIRGRAVKSKTDNLNSSCFHFIITNGFGGADGAVEVNPLWSTQQDCIPNLDSGKIHPLNAKNIHETISICLIGDFTVQPPTVKQIASLKSLLNFLLEETAVKSFNISFNTSGFDLNTRSPEFFPLELLLKTRTSSLN